MAILAFFIAQMVGLILLQKIGFPVGGAGLIQAAFPIFYGSLIALVAFYRFKIDRVRALLYGLFCLAVFISTVLNRSGQSSASLMLALLLYFPFIFYYDVTNTQYRRMVNIFIFIMIGACAIVAIQHAIQFTSSWRNWINLDQIVPQDFLMTDYIYLQPIKYKSAFYKPNAIFFLEVSFLSQFIALALVLEAIYFQRVWALTILAGTVVATFAGTGLLLLLVAAPVLLLRPNMRLIVLALLVTVFAVTIGIKIGWFDQVQHRLGETSRAGSSADQRFVEPVLLIFEFVKGQNTFFTGWGAGSIEKALHVAWWPVTKVTVEYGILTAVMFYVFFTYSLFASAPSRRAAFAFFVFYNFLGGGFVLPVYVLPCLIFCSLFRTPHDADKAARSLRAHRKRPESGSSRVRSTQPAIG